MYLMKKKMRNWSSFRLKRHIIELEKKIEELEEGRTRTFKLPDSYKMEDDER